MAKKSIFGRGVRLASLAAKVASKEIGYKISKSIDQKVEQSQKLKEIKLRVEQAKLITESLSQLKGAAMKAGQMISLDAGDFLPQEALDILSQLQNKANPYSFADIENVLKEELNEEILSRLEIEKEAFAAASIGQVHRARWNNQDIVLKIQYPGVRESIDSDLALLKTLVEGLGKLYGKKSDLSDLFKEVSVVLHQEADYERERDVLFKVQEKMKGESLLRAPQPIAELCQSRVLAMSFEKGIPLTEWIKTATPSEKSEIGQRFLELYVKEFLEWNMVQTDPNFANFLIDKDQIVMLDFGATLFYDNEFISFYKELLRKTMSASEDEILMFALEHKLIDPRESDEAKENFVEMMRVSVMPFKEEVQPFAFADQEYSERSKNTILKFSKSLVYTPPPKKLIFLHRKLGGLFNLLKRMKGQANLRPFWDKMIE